MSTSVKSQLYNTIKNLSRDRKLIYIMGVPNSKYYKGLVKVGDASEPTPEQNNKPNSNDLKRDARKRISQYMTTAGLPFKVYYAELAYKPATNTFFRDYDVHSVLKRSGYKNPMGEWFKVSPQIAEKAIQAVKLGKKSIKNVNDTKDNIIFRPEQRDIIYKTVKHFKQHNKRSKVMLWNAKMRFGKTLCALAVAKEMNYHHTLIITHRPIVDNGWFKDFRKLLGKDDRYSYGSKQNGESLNNLKLNNKRFFYFASLQDLVGSIYANGKFNKDNGIFHTKWDLLIIDEAHEGTQTKRAQSVIKALNPKKRLLLSGTPFNLLANNSYDNSQVCTWDYIDEQYRKQHWTDVPGHTNWNNPYGSLPQVKMYTFEMGQKFSRFRDAYTKFFNFDRFFAVKNNHFVYEEYIKQFLKNITMPDSKTNYPFSTPQYRKQIKHSLWILPSRKSAGALKKLLNKDPVFMEYHVINIVDNNDGSAENDTKRVETAIHKYNYTITLTVRKMTLGVTIPQWTAVIFLSDTSSPSQYLQSAFRAQTPYISKNLCYRKSTCYVFDFAPKRALKMATSTVQLKQIHHGKITPNEQKEHLTQLLNFLPIIGKQNNRMKEYNVPELLQSLKRNYAERAVNTGFATKELYNDKLLINMPPEQLNLFDYVEQKVGFTKGQQRKNETIINNQGLPTQEYKKINQPNHIPTSSEQKEINRARQRRDKLISILRSVSIRIPLMIYGMNIPLNEDIKIKDFTDHVDNESWAEFMPNGITKKIFNKLTPYYDADVFIKAGKIIRAKVEAVDNLDPIVRTDKIAKIFSHFRNPDKETVLTPWRVVNMHLGKTLGGFSHYKDDHYIKSGNHWIKNSNKLFYNPKVHILEINSKTGLYPLYMVTSLYYLAFNKMDAESAGRFSYDDELDLWYKILRNNIFLIAKTPMAKQIAVRTLVGYKDPKVHIIYEDNLVKKAKDNPDKEVSRIEERFNNMKFDVVIGNPPYQKSDNGAFASADPIYQYFVNISEKLSEKYVSLIMPAKWYTGGKGLNKFRTHMLNDQHIKLMYDFMTPEDVFPHTIIKGGLTIFLWDRDYNNHNRIRVINIKNHRIIGNTYRPLKLQGLNIFIRDSKAVTILDKIPFNNGTIKNFVSKSKPFGFRTYFVKSKKFKLTSKHMKHPIKIYGRKINGYVEKDLVTKNKNWINKYKVLTACSNNIGTQTKDDNLNTIIGKPGSVCTETYVVVGANLNLDKQSAINLSKYLKTKFTRYLISLAKSTQHATRKVYRFVPLQNFTSNSDINWNESLDDIDQQLFDKYHITNSQQQIIKNTIASLTNVK